METQSISAKAIILDVDGVITDTRKLHFKAWKKIFDQILAENKINAVFRQEDYEKYVDGKPRQDGLTSYLDSRSLHLTKNQLENLSIRKDQFFKEFLKTDKPEVFPDARKAISKWRKNKIQLGAISSSKNSRLILEQAGLLDSFDVCIDGEEGERLHLAGKPDPAYLFEATKRLSLDTEDCVLIEDAISGVAAGKKALFKEVVGISRPGQTAPDELYAAGADTVVRSLLEIGKIPNALEAWEDIKSHVGSKDVALFIDFDGTLSEIVADPNQATIKESIKDVLHRCSASIKIAVISGRDRIDVKGRVGIDDIFYVGSHGLDMCGPGCFYYQVEDAEKFSAELQDATMAATLAFQKVKGVYLERKSFSTAIHYRMVADDEVDSIRVMIFDMIKNFPNLRAKEGKKVIEIFPDIAWGKGEAVKKLSEILNIDPEFTLPIYLGDDLTDEDAFKELRHKGIGIKIDDGSHAPTKAGYFLNNTGEVEKFLNLICLTYTGENKKWRAGL